VVVAVVALPLLDTVEVVDELAPAAAELLLVLVAAPAAAPSSSTVVVVVDAEPLGKELDNRSLVAAPNSENGFVIALSNQAPEEAPPEAIRFSAVPAMLAIGLDTVSSIPARIPSAKTLLAFDKLVAMFCMATPAVVIGRPKVSLYIFAIPSVPVSTLSVPALTIFFEDRAKASVIPSTTFPFLIRVDELDATAAAPPAPAAEAPPAEAALAPPAPAAAAAPPAA